MTIHAKNFIAGEWVAPATDEYFENVNPADRADVIRAALRPRVHVGTKFRLEPDDVRHRLLLGALERDLRAVAFLLRHRTPTSAPS